MSKNSDLQIKLLGDALFADKPIQEEFYIDRQDYLNTPHLYYSHPNGEIWVGDSFEWLIEYFQLKLHFLSSNSVTLIQKHQ